MKKYILSLILLASAVSAVTKIDAITAAEAGDSNAYDAGIVEFYQSDAGSAESKIGSLATADVNKPNLKEQIKTELKTDVQKTKEFAARAKAKISSSVARSKDFIARNYDRAKTKTHNLWERVKSWFNSSKSTQVKA